MKDQKAYLYLIVTFALWGSLYVVSKYVLGKVPTFTISLIRFIIAFITLVLIRGKSNDKIEKKDYKYIFCLGFVGYFIAVGAQLLGTRYAGASMASLMNSMNPVTMAIFASFFLHERLTTRKIISTILALIGVYIILGNKGKNYSFIGIIYSIVAVLTWSAISVLVRKLTQKYPSLLITQYGIAVAIVFYIPLSIYEICTVQTFDFDFNCILALLYMGIMCTGVAYLLWNKCLEKLPAGVCSAFYPIQPLISTLCGVLFLHESVKAPFIIGSIFIVVGVWTSLVTFKIYTLKKSMYN